MQKPADILCLQKLAHAREPYPSYKARIDRLDRLLVLLKSEQWRLCEAIAEDFGTRSSENSRLFDILPSVHAIKFAKSNLKSWMKPERRRSSFPYNWVGGRSYTRAVPLGVVGNVSPWNFPVTLSLSPLGGVLAAGNRVMLKPSEFTPATSDVLHELICQYFDVEEIAVITGGADVAQSFTRLPFDHLLFTGSTSVGRKVAEAAAPNLVPTTLELGGKSPVMISATADINQIATKLMFAKTMNAGQICLAPDYVLVQASQLDTLTTALKQVARQLFPEGVDNTDYVNMISVRHAERLRSLLKEAVDNGNEVVPLFEQVATNDARRLAPHLVIMKGEQGQIMEEEIFGPVLPIVVVDSFADALSVVQAKSSPLALYYFGDNQQEIQTLENQVRCGGMVINDLLTHFLQDDLPFGGVGDSGMGQYHGREGFDQFSHKKSIFVSPRWDLGKIMRPPYSNSLRRYLKVELGE